MDAADADDSGDFNGLVGASFILCCYAAILRALPISNSSDLIVAEARETGVALRKISRNVSARAVSPACIAGVRSSVPKRRPRCGLRKL